MGMCNCYLRVNSCRLKYSQNFRYIFSTFYELEWKYVLERNVRWWGLLKFASGRRAAARHGSCTSSASKSSLSIIYSLFVFALNSTIASQLTVLPVCVTAGLDCDLLTTKSYLCISSHCNAFYLRPK